MIDALTLLGTLANYAIIFRTPIVLISIMIGIWVIIQSFMRLQVHAATPPSQMAMQRDHMGGIVFQFIIGVLLINMDLFLSVLWMTFLGDAQLHSAESIFSAGGDVQTLNLLSTDISQTMMTWVIIILQVLGVLAVLNGLVVLNAVANNSHSATLGAGLTRVIAGSMLANFSLFWRIIDSSII